MIRTVLVEDEPLARDMLRSFIALRSDIDLVGEAGDGLAGIQIVNELSPDLLLLDISLPECSGLDLLHTINRSPAVIFTTAFDSYALAAFELGAFDYLLKPFSYERFNAAIERVAARCRSNESEPSVGERIANTLGVRYLEQFFVRHLGMTLPIRVEDIVRLEADDDYTAVHLAGKRYLVHIAIRDMEMRLNPKYFLRVHRSSIVNLLHVRSASQSERRFTLSMSDGSKVSSSRSHAQAIRELHL
jgi:two-component system LytT family response regulator